MIVDLLRASEEDGRPAYERYADVLAKAIRSGTVPPGAKLPTVRNLAADLRVSATTVMSIYGKLSDYGLAAGEPGRGTFVTYNGTEAVATNAQVAHRGTVRRRNEPWRRRSLAEAEAHLRDRFPAAMDLMRGSPASRLLPLELINRARISAVGKYTRSDLEYPHSITVEPELRRLVIERFERDGVYACPESTITFNSAQQVISLVSQLLVRTSDDQVIAAVEEPGYQTAMDTLERTGCRLVGMDIDDRGVTPGALRSALAAGAKLIVLTPRALSPTGSTWDAARRAELATVVASAKDVWVLEDDYFAELAHSQPGSLTGDARLRDRVVHVRSFSKSLGPDLRIAVAVVGQVIRDALNEERAYADGWTSLFAQRSLAEVLADPALDEHLADAAAQYRANRRAMAAALGEWVPSVTDGIATEGFHIWVPLPEGVRSHAVVEAAAHAGFLVADGEPFFLDPGRRDFIRVNAASSEAGLISKIAHGVGEAVSRSAGRGRVLLSP